MAAIPIPGVNTPTYQSWGAAVANKLNTATTLVALADVTLSTPNQIVPVAIPGATGPCLIAAQGTLRINAGGQYIAVEMQVGTTTKAIQYGNGQGAGGFFFPFHMMIPVPEGSTGRVVFTLGAAAIAGQVTGITALVIPVTGTATATAIVTRGPDGP